MFFWNLFKKKEKLPITTFQEPSCTLDEQQSFEPDYMFLISIHKKNILTAEKSPCIDKKVIEKHLDQGYIQYSTIQFTLQNVTIPVLKNLLLTKQLKTSGKKAELIARITENFSEQEIRSSITDSFYQRTPKGEKVVKKWLEKKQIEHLSEIKKIANMILNQQFKDAMLEIRSKNSFVSATIDDNGKVSFIETPNEDIIYSSSDNMINAIPLYMKDIGTTEQRILYIAVDCILLQSNPGYVNMVIDDLHDLGYEVSEAEVLHVAQGCYNYCELLNIKETFPDDKYYFISSVHDSRTCERCRSLDKKSFAIADAKIGKTLPPFCYNCRCIIQAESIYKLSSKNKS